MSARLVLILSLAACGGGGSSDPDAGAVDAPAQVPDAPPDASPPDAPPEDPQGIVILSEQDLDGMPQSTAGVTIFPGHAFGLPLASVGACEVFGEPSEMTLSAGVVSITGTTVPITLTPNGSMPPVSYTTTPDPTPADLFADGATISASAIGDQVPAFSGSVTAPAPLEGVVLPTSLSRSRPTNLTWTAGSGEGAWVWVVGFDPQAQAIGIVWCRTGDTGSFAVPAAAVAMFPAGFTEGLAIVWRVNDAPVTAGSWEIQLTAADAVGSGLLPIEP